MTLNFVMIVEDAGELKTVTASEFLIAMQALFEPEHDISLPDVETMIDDSLNKVLDTRAIAAGEYDPADNDTPMIITGGEGTEE